ncbi:MAG TPA: hypothetical protein VL282_13415 [Tepidisphaeraceae bacterium]|jgi:hypothetical protein|nr:hypothetical protein [Tepidisphaeraceae bacterium]
MWRRLFKLVTIASTFALLIAMILWIVSYKAGGVTFTWIEDDFVLEGQLRFTRLDAFSAEKGIFSIDRITHREPVARTKPPSPLPFLLRDEARERKADIEVTRLAVPFWAMVIAFSILPLAWLKAFVKCERLENQKEPASA